MDTRLQSDIWFTGHQVELPEMLDGRERRVRRQNVLLDKFGATLVCFTLNIAGPVKVFPLSEEAFDAGVYAMDVHLESAGIIYREILRHPYGHEAFYVMGSDPLTVKRLLSEIETEHPLGRLFDMDVLRPDGTKVSREEVGLPGRRCMICGEPASDCAGARRHSVAELQAHTVGMILDYEVKCGPAASFIGRAAKTALLLEVYTTPKPGLVDQDNTGSHTDMDVELFEKSAEALEPYFRDCFEAGRAHRDMPADQLLSVLRPMGIKAEHDMYDATDGINTHKGMIYSLGIICGAMGWYGSLYTDRDPSYAEPQEDYIPRPDRHFVRELEQEDLIRNDPLWLWVLRTAGEIGAPALARDLGLEAIRGRDMEITAGQRQYINYGLTGIRGEVAAGFPAVQSIGMPLFIRLLEADVDYMDAGMYTLLFLIANVTDSNMIARGGLEVQRMLQDEVRELLSGDTFPDRERIRELDREFISYNVSPGGCADLLAIIYFLTLVFLW